MCVNEDVNEVKSRGKQRFARAANYQNVIFVVGLNGHTNVNNVGLNCSSLRMTGTGSNASGSGGGGSSGGGAGGGLWTAVNFGQHSAHHVAVHNAANNVQQQTIGHHQHTQSHNNNSAYHVTLLNVSSSVSRQQLTNGNAVSHQAFNNGSAGDPNCGCGTFGLSQSDIGERILEKILAVLTRMERNEIILTVVLSTVAALVSMGLTFLLCHWCSRRKRKRRTDELDSLQSILSPDATTSDKKNGPGSGVNHGSSIEPDAKNNSVGKSPMGTLSAASGAFSNLKLKTPNIRTKGVGAQLENESLTNSYHPDGSNNVQQHQQPGSKNTASGTKDQAHQFYPTRSLSQIDMYIDQSESNDNCGQIQFSLEYDFQASTLQIKIIQAKGIPAMDLSGTSDPYVRVTLLPDKKHRLDTKIKRRTLHPRWNETFYFEGFPIQKLQSRVLHLHVFDYDRFSRDDSIGEVYMPLCQVDLSEKPVFWKSLKAPIKDKCGEILVSISYHPSNSELTLVIIKARNLKAKDINGKSDPYVKVWLQHGEKKVEKKKTCIIKRTLDPVYNESFVFAVPWEKLRETSLLVQVMDFDSVGRNELIGKILLCAKGGVTESKHWNEMINKARQTVLQWHRLKPE